MEVIAIMNLKGGVAKTVTAVNLAAILQRDHEQSVLVIDADSQANATEFLGGGPEGRSLADLLRIPKAERTPFTVRFESQQIITPSTVDGVDLLPADDRLMDLDLSRAETGDAWVDCLRALRKAGGFEEYSTVLIDCPPAFNSAAAAALLAADSVLIPIKLDAFSLRGLGNLLRQIDNMRKLNPQLRILGILPTMWRRCDEAEDAALALRCHGLPLLPRVRYSPTVDRMTYRQRPLIETSPKSGALRDYRAVARWLVEGGADDGV